MPDPSNAAIADAFDELGDLYELTARSSTASSPTATPRRRCATRRCRSRALTREGRVTELPGIGKTLEEKILALLETGTIPAAEKLRAKFPPGLMDLTRLPGLGPKRARKLFDELGIDSLEALRERPRSQQLRDVRGFGPKFEESMLAALDAGVAERAGAARAAPQGARDRRRDRRRAARAPGRRCASSSPAARGGWPTRSRTSTSSRRRRPAGAGRRARRRSTSSSARRRRARTPARARTHTGCRSTCASSSPSSSATSCSTSPARRGTTSRCARRRCAAGCTSASTGSSTTRPARRCAARPRRRSTRGSGCRGSRRSCARTAASSTPGFVVRELVDQRGPASGDLHCHTTASDGRNIDRGDGARRARARAASTSRSPTTRRRTASATTSRPTSCGARSSASREVDDEVDGIEVLVGTETNILPDGSPDYDDELLAELDWVVGSVHTSLRHAASGDDRADGRRDRAPVDRRDRPPDRPQDRAARSRTRSTSTRSSRPRRAPGRCSRSTRRRTAATSTTSTRARPREAGVSILIDSDAHGVSDLEHVALGRRDRAPRVARRRRSREHAAVGGVRAAAQAGAGSRPSRQQPRQQLAAPPTRVDRARPRTAPAPPRAALRVARPRRVQRGAQRARQVVADRRGVRAPGRAAAPRTAPAPAS